MCQRGETMIPLDSAFQFCVLQPQEPSPARALSVIHSLPVQTPEQFFDSFEKAANIMPKHIGNKMTMAVMRTSKCVACKKETVQKVRRFSLPVTPNVVNLQSSTNTSTESILQSMFRGAQPKSSASLGKGHGSTVPSETCKHCGSTIEPSKEYKITEIGEIMAMLLHVSGPSVLVSQTIKASGVTYNLGGVVCMGESGLSLIVCSPTGCSVVRSDKGNVIESRVDIKDISRFLNYENSKISQLGRPIAAIYRYDFTLSKSSADLDVKVPKMKIDIDKNNDDGSDINEDIFGDKKFLKELRRAQNSEQLEPVSPQVTKNRDSKDGSRRRKNDPEDSFNGSYTITQFTPDEAIPFNGTNPNSRINTSMNVDINGKPMGSHSQRPMNASISMPVNSESSSNPSGTQRYNNNNNGNDDDIMILTSSDQSQGMKSGSSSQTIKSYNSHRSRSGMSSTGSYSRSSRSKNYRSNVKLMVSNNNFEGSGSVNTDTMRYTGPGTLNLKTTQLNYGSMNSNSEVVLYNQENNTVSNIPYVRSKLITSKIAFTVIIILIILLAFAAALLIALIVEFCLWAKSYEDLGLVGRFNSLTVNTVNVIGMESSSQSSEVKTNDVSSPEAQEDEEAYDLLVYGSIVIDYKGSSDTSSSTYVQTLDTNSLKATRMDLSSVPVEMDSTEFDVFDIILDENDRIRSDLYPNLRIQTATLLCETLTMETLRMTDSTTSLSTNQATGHNGIQISTRLEVGVQKTTNSIKGGAKIVSDFSATDTSDIKGTIFSDYADINIAKSKFNTKDTTISGIFNAPITTTNMNVTTSENQNILYQSTGYSSTIPKEVYVFNSHSDIYELTNDDKITVGALELEEELEISKDDSSFNVIQGGTTIYSPDCKIKDLVYEISGSDMTLNAIIAEYINIENTDNVENPKAAFNMTSSIASKLSLLIHGIENKRNLCIGDSCETDRKFIINIETDIQEELQTTTFNLLDNNITYKEENGGGSDYCQITYDSNLNCHTIKTNHLQGNSITILDLDLSNNLSPIKTLIAENTSKVVFNNYPNNCTEGNCKRAKIKLANQSSFTTTSANITTDTLTLLSGCTINAPSTKLSIYTHTQDSTEENKVYFTLHKVQTLETPTLDLNEYSLDISQISSNKIKIDTLNSTTIDFNGGNFSLAGNLDLTGDTITSLETGTLTMDDNTFVNMTNNVNIDICINQITVKKEDTNNDLLTISSGKIKNELNASQLTGYSMKNIQIGNFTGVTNTYVKFDNANITVADQLSINKSEVTTLELGTENSNKSFTLSTSKIEGYLISKGEYINIKRLLVTDTLDSATLNSVSGGESHAKHIYGKEGTINTGTN